MNTTKAIRRKNAQRGFSLLEMAIVLVIVGLLAIALWKFIPQWRSIDETQPVQAQLALADEAIIGFVMAYYRLPCPDINGDGKEDRNSEDNGCAVSVGGFPFQTLGIRSQELLRYGVYEEGGAKNLTAASNRHTPLLPKNPTGETEWPLSKANAYDFSGFDPDTIGIPPEYESSFDFGDLDDIDIKNLSTLDNVKFVRTDPGFGGMETLVNGLDFCTALYDIHGSGPSSAFLRAGSVPVAYLLVHPGIGDADNNGSFFDLTNASDTAVFEMPGKAVAHDYDDHVLATGFGELATRLSCPSYLSRANGAAHTARAAYDHYLFALAFLQFRAFAYDVAFLDLQAANAGVVLGVFNLVASIASAVFTTAAGVLTVDEGVGVVLLAAAAVVAAVAIAGSIVEIGFAVNSLVAAAEGVDEAGAMRIEAEVHAHKMLETADTTARRAVMVNSKGLLP